jgi:hypothetical protein
VMPLVRICAGGVGCPTSLPRPVQCAGREYDSALPLPAGTAWIDPGYIQGGSESAGGATAVAARAGTIVDATIIAAPSSTKNASASRDPEMKQTP